ncbi:CopD family protein [Reichenbachiella versicolor]|uniref:CopD family protein n=1 Tax=Reichenbachiella versicolor TaxID=1821036 RepID=UPI000D6E4682|nr:CopD family protein [Reichenbachiella versicolor]
MTYFYLKALHIIFVTTWFAGLFYIVRLFIYSTEAQEKPEPEKSILYKQLMIMQNRLLVIITHPSAIITLIIGVWLAVATNFWKQPWFHVKALFLIGLYSYHLICSKIHKQMQKGVFKYTSNQLRIWNEVATIFLFAIVFIVVLKSTFTWIFGVMGLIILSIILMLGIKIYKRLRNEK